ncbi:hypothetical protein Ssi03_56100 [Sphaerisporangium siamense]|uniref:Uncharacterized protein n=1 Tax=Sphaerisporangium siamense TaxID=795645 RepID=A0A7W7DC98_9ACTN|nr:hypothetical protein [Sphaerisporangium siamense]MBB4703385.1 hypothetical protein [Sphaerisporangium siamense]GII87620.1 hypothetical protein Ssi03_56100 [Sphaerisporangium siamense]
MSAGEWAPVVYGRTLHHDHWWRAGPAGPDGLGWVREAVRAVVDRGQDLDLGPRFLIAHRGGPRLVGVACQAAELGAGMDTDGGRPLYCFVGWLQEARDRSAPPPLGELRARYRAWAGPEYARWVGLDWTLPAHETPRTHPAPAAPPPWDGTAAGPAPVPLRTGGGVELWPPEEAAVLWASAAASAGPVTAVAGLRFSRRARRLGLTHAAADDVTRRQVLPAPSTEVAARPQAVREPPPRADGWSARLARAARRLTDRLR